VHPRHPYGGELVFTAFSGSHQDAIKKGLAARNADLAHGNEIWDVPYLPIDPADLGRSYEAVIRVNSQSGKGGIAYLLERDHGLTLPRLLQIEFSQVIQAITDASGKELSSAEIHAAFEREYLAATSPVTYAGHRAQHSGADGTVEHLTAHLHVEGAEAVLHGAGNGPVDAFVAAVRTGLGIPIHVINYHEHAIGAGEDAMAVAYVQLRVGADRTIYGVGRDANIVTATLRALVSAINRGVGVGALTLRAKQSAVA
jgi:2-isopropylmalate synthase